MEGYEKIVPGAAKQLVDLLVQQAHHRMDHTKTMEANQHSEITAGLWGSMIVAIISAALSAAVAFWVEPWAGVTIFACYAVTFGRTQSINWVRYLMRDSNH